MSEAPPPMHSKDSEQHLLGALLAHGQFLDHLFGTLRAEDFFFDAHQRIYRCIAKRYDAGKAWDAALVCEDLIREKSLEDIGGAGYLAHLWELAPVGATADYHAAIIADYALRRDAMHRINEFARDLADHIEPAHETIARLAESFLHAERSRAANEPKTITEAINTKLQQLDDLTKPDGKRPITTGFTGLNQVVGGWRPGEFVVIGARPSVGKSAIALSFLLAATKSGAPAALFSLEMAAEEFGARALAHESDVQLNYLTGTSTIDQAKVQVVAQTAQQLRGCPLWIDDNAAHTPSSISATARRLVSKYKVGLIVIDYLQLIRHEGGRNDQQYVKVGETAKRLKLLARSLGVPVVCLAQLNREVETRGSGRPQMSDLRESGEIEQNADVVALLWPQSATATSETQEITVIIEKQRNGPKGEVKLNYRRKHTRFESGVPTW
jgi:replicative DNA helicase